MQKLRGGVDKVRAVNRVRPSFPNPQSTLPYLLEKGECSRFPLQFVERQARAAAMT